MTRKRQLSLLSALIISSLSFACASDAAEDRIIDVIETVYYKVDSASDCEKLTSEITPYCKKISRDLNADIQEILAYRSDIEVSNKLRKIYYAMLAFDKVEDSKCGDKDDVQKAVGICFDSIENGFEKANFKADAPTKHVIDVIETIYDEVDDAKDCKKLAQNVSTLCQNDSKKLENSINEIITYRFEKDVSKKIDKIQEKLNKFDTLENSQCGQETDIQKAVDICFDIIEEIFKSS